MQPKGKEIQNVHYKDKENVGCNASSTLPLEEKNDTLGEDTI